MRFEVKHNSWNLLVTIHTFLPTFGLLGHLKSFEIVRYNSMLHETCSALNLMHNDCFILMFKETLKLNNDK